VKPWTLARADGGGEARSGRQLDIVLWDLAECLRLVAEALRPLLPETAARIARQLGVGLASSWTQGLHWGGLGDGTRVRAATPLFPRREPGQAASRVGE
jgi:methionyl-tRNA synthetase